MCYFQDLPGEYSATLTINNLSADLSGKANKLTVTNSEGTTEYMFQLELGAKPEVGKF